MFTPHTLNRTALPDPLSGSFFAADWAAPANVRTLITTRNGGTSQGAFASLNMGAHVGDHPEHVAANRAQIQRHIPLPVAYLNQTHSTRPVQAYAALYTLCDADAAVDKSGKAACAVMTADCLPVLLCDSAGTVVAAAHAGWRGLAGGIVEQTIAAMQAAPTELMAYLAPAISADAFEVGQDVLDTFCAKLPEHEHAFRAIGGGKYLADIYALARNILHREGIHRISGGDRCTVLERDTFFSYRRDGQTGRMASIIWLEPVQAA